MNSASITSVCGCDELAECAQTDQNPDRGIESDERGEYEADQDEQHALTLGASRLLSSLERGIRVPRMGYPLGVNTLFLALMLAAIGLTWWVRTRIEHTRSRIAACAHEYHYASAWDEGVYWVRKCQYCPFQEPVTDEELVSRLRRDRTSP